MMEIKFCPVCAQSLEHRSDEQEAGKIRLACPEGHWTHWDNPLPVLAALVEVEGHILLARNAAWPEKVFALITGFMERGETPEQGIARELKEETNLDADQINLIGVYEFIKKNEVIIAYHVKASGEIRLSPELLEYRLIQPEKLRPWRAGTGYAMADWMRANGLEPVFADWGSS
ncbi:NUDIX domain-containing protein [Undibacterium sp. RTI2.1]|uniref:NUDIX domain-containing protein n=2 Tax=Pseudomonadota TaxID=1224 RepID=UPI002AB4B87D|nr:MULTISPECIES: NUDIX domain-containing protein [unclassified Undibacterium]MDY7538590.1 NUDIX domain-containing protein [Undibacterium sp. 5I1]MEB0031279.1 NUDIX domain-containing protein [Undibacterium sp. RTI2.1]MEB0116329.1 NUDIX domain-containing protein [Undibacterium sp. RTI2.2]MEB0232192.1 NUDIX domain-containing protein [Undibacterium sp. 10I3]MEB0258092.1 NUDIX domain-containing protein [Undibacterium sp. 5I1]